jgi:hypothetical protein
LKRKEAEIFALQDAVLKGRASRNAGVDKRRLDAIDQLWEAVHMLNSGKGAVQYAQFIKFSEVSKNIETDKKLQQVFKAMAPDIKLLQDPSALSHKARPFVSEPAWALFAAYQAVIGHAVGALYLLSNGFPTEKFMTGNVSALVKLALPHLTDYLDEHGTTGAYFSIDQLETQLLSVLRKSLDGAEVDEQELERAARISEMASNLANKTAESVQKTGP